MNQANLTPSILVLDNYILLNVTHLPFCNRAIEIDAYSFLELSYTLNNYYVLHLPALFTIGFISLLSFGFVSFSSSNNIFVQLLIAH